MRKAHFTKFKLSARGLYILKLKIIAANLRVKYLGKSDYLILTKRVFRQTGDWLSEYA